MFLEVQMSIFYPQNPQAPLVPLLRIFTNVSLNQVSSMKLQNQKDKADWLNRFQITEDNKSG